MTGTCGKWTAQLPRPRQHAGTITLNTLANLNATNFPVTIPPATANFLISDSSSKLIQQPRDSRARTARKPRLKIGERVPVATGSFQPGIGGVGINPLVNTQFNYIDVGVNIDITPHVHGLDEVTLKLAMDISAVDSYQNIGGIQQPVIGQRKIEQEIRLQRRRSQHPGRNPGEHGRPSRCPASPDWRRFRFSSTCLREEQKEGKRQRNRLHPDSAHRSRAGDPRTQHQGDRCRHRQHNFACVSTATRLPSSSSQPVKQPVAGRHPAKPGSSRGPTSSRGISWISRRPRAPAGSADCELRSATLDQAVGSTFTVNVNLAGGQNVSSVPLQIMYNPRVLQLVNVSNGTLLAQDGQTVALVNRDDSMAGILQLTASRPPGTSGISGDGSVFTLTFQARAPGQSTLSINRAMLKNAAMQNIPASGSQAIVTVH